VTHAPVGVWERFPATDRPRAGGAGRNAPLGGAATGAAVLMADLSTVMLICALC
jgi:hypothetical protein